MTIIAHFINEMTSRLDLFLRHQPPPVFASQDEARVVTALCVSSFNNAVCKSNATPYSNAALRLFQGVQPAWKGNQEKPGDSSTIRISGERAIIR